MVNLLLHDPPNAGYMNGTRKSSQTLLDEITAGISSSSLKIRLSDGTTVSPHSLQLVCAQQSVGTTVGIVVGCLAAGCILGILLVVAVVGIYKCMKRTGKTSSVSYNVQEDDQ